MNGKRKIMKIAIIMILILGLIAAWGCQPNLDLSTQEKSAETIMTALKKNDVNTLKKCVSSRILQEIGGDAEFKKFFTAWRNELVWFSCPESFVREVNLSEEDGSWKLNEM